MDYLRSYLDFIRSGSFMSTLFLAFITIVAFIGIIGMLFNFIIDLFG
jgi:hypothetical protein